MAGGRLTPGSRGCVSVSCSCCVAGTRGTPRMGGCWGSEPRHEQRGPPGSLLSANLHGMEDYLGLWLPCPPEYQTHTHTGGHALLAYSSGCTCSVAVSSPLIKEQCLKNTLYSVISKYIPAINGEKIYAGGVMWISTQASGFLAHVGDQEIPQKTGTGQPLKHCPELCVGRERRASPSAASSQALDPSHKACSLKWVILFRFYYKQL